MMPPLGQPRFLHLCSHCQAASITVPRKAATVQPQPRYYHPSARTVPPEAALPKQERQGLYKARCADQDRHGVARQLLARWNSGELTHNEFDRGRDETGENSNFATTMIVLVVGRIAWADDVRTSWSCSKANDEKTCSFDITIQGEIVPAMLEGVKKALVERQEMIAREGGWSDLWIIHLDSPGGSVQTAFDIGRLLRSANAPVAIGPDKRCVSACVLILAGATGRLIDGRVGIHRPYFETPNTDVDFNDVQKVYNKMTEQIRAYLREMNVSDRLADDMMIVPPEKVRFLSSVELANYGLGLEDPVIKE
jgi:ATP-dependent protease ClpP protease subunit